MIFQRLKRPQLIIVFVLLLAALTRFWQLANLFHWTLDEEYWSYVSHNIATGYHLPLIGGPIGGTGVYTGPLFVWFIGLYMWFTQSNPLALAILVSLVGVISTYGVYILGKAYGNRVAVIGATVYATSTLTILYDRKFWNASLAPILSIMGLWLMDKLRSKPHLKYSVLLGSAMALAIHAHMTGLVLCIWVVVSFIVYKLPKRYVWVTLATFIFLQIPLLVFDIRHDFINTKAITLVLTGQASTSDNASGASNPALLLVNTLARWLYTPALDIANELTLCPQLSHRRVLPPLMYQILSALILGYIFWQFRNRQPKYILLLINFLLVFIYSAIAPASFYPGQLAEYYFLPSFPVFALVLGEIGNKVYSKIPLLVTALVLFIVIINLHTILNVRHTQGYAKKLATVITTIGQIQTPFDLEVNGQVCFIYGYRYLFTWLGKEPVSSYLDGSFSWLYQKRLPKETVKQSVLIDADFGTMAVTNVE